MADRSFFVPPRPNYPEREISIFRVFAASKTNPLLLWPDVAYERDSFTQRSLGRTWILLNHPNAIHHVLVENPGNYRRSPATIRILRPITGQGLLLSEGDDWKHQRRTIAPALAPRMMALLVRHMASAAHDLVVTLSSSTNKPIDLLGWMYFVALEIAGRSMFSLEMRQFGPAMRDMLGNYTQDLARPFFFDLVLPVGIPTFRDLRRRRYNEKWMQLIDRMIDARAAAPADGKARDLFDLLLHARDPETGEGFSRAKLRDEVATMIVAGHETTALALFWALYLLASVPDEQDTLIAELRDCDVGVQNIAERLSNLPHLRAVIAETLRLYPPAFTLVRQALAKDEAGELTIPKGSLVMIAPWVLHRHRRFWRDPDAFDPSRFLPDTPPPPRFAYLPFGAGPRVCIGAQFALTEATVVLATLVKAFHIELADHEPVLPKPIITTVPNRAPPFWIRPRHPV